MVDFAEYVNMYYIIWSIPSNQSGTKNSQACQLIGLDVLLLYPSSITLVEPHVEQVALEAQALV